MFTRFQEGAAALLTPVLSFLHDVVAAVPFMEAAAWGWAIILLTLFVRILLLPLAIKQTRSMRAMQKLQPQLKELQKKYKVDRSLMKKDPEQYRAKRQKLNEEMMSLYQREGANPAASCLPLLAQAPVFIALFWTLIGAEELRGAEFYFFTAFGEGGLEQLVSGAGWPGWLLILLMSGTMFWSQRQMMLRNASQMADNPMAQQQKILLYVMPVFLAVISFRFPMGVLLYWVTTNVWQVAQQAIILREIHKSEEREEEERRAAAAPPKAPKGSRKGATSGTKKPEDADDEPEEPEEPKQPDEPDEAADGSKAAPKEDDRGQPSQGRGKKRTKGPTPAGLGQDGTGGGQPPDNPNGQMDGQPPSDGPIAKGKKRDHLPRRRGQS